MKTLRGWNALWVVMIALGCSDSDESGPIDAGPRDGASPGDASRGAIDSAMPDADGPAEALKVATFNAGLLDSVGFVAARAPHVVDALGGLDAELLCVQEFWQDAHWDQLVDASEDARPHTHRLSARPGVEGQCTPDEFNPLEACAREHCADVGADNLVACTSEECPDEVGVLSGTCISCLLDNTSDDIDAIAAACAGAAGGAGDAGVPSPEERAYLLGGSFGLGLLSALPFAETDTLEFDSSTNRRGVLYAELEPPGLGSLHVFCTHLAPIDDGIRYEGSYGSWEAENRAHVEATLAWIDDKAGEDGRVVLLGDLNDGPGGQDRDGETLNALAEDNYDALIDAGFDNAFLDDEDAAACTFCADNALVRNDDPARGAAIDHILTRGVRAHDAMRLFTDPVEITTEVPAAADGGAADAGTTTVEREVPLSDHYGLELTLGE